MRRVTAILRRTRRRMAWCGRWLALLLALGGTAHAQPSKSPAGRWDATVAVPGLNNFEVPFSFEITLREGIVAGSFFDGDVQVRSTAGSFRNGALTLLFAQYGSRIDATLIGDRLEGRYDRGTRRIVYPLKAVRAPATPPAVAHVPSLAGEWRIPLAATSNGEKAWRFVIRQEGAQFSGAVMRVDGDTGTLSGRFKDGHVVMSHFSGARPTAFDVTPLADGTLAIVQDGATKLTALRVTDKRAQVLPAPTNPREYTRVRNPDEKFRFAFPGLDGKMVTEADARFQGKVVIVSITGSWCPNCHDEAPFMAKLYRDYRSKGLEIVAIAFEEADQLKNPERVRAFIAQFGLTYPFLIGGTPEEAPDKIPQAVNLTTFPATFVLGKDGRVRAVHAGYASKATGEFYAREQRAFLSEIDRLLAERAPASR